MTSSDTSSLSFHRERLLHERTQLLQRIAEQRGGLVSRADMAADHFDNSFQSRAQIRSERQTEFAINEHETAELGDIEAALERMDAGTYGQCTDCGVTIPSARLSAYPTAKRCIDCQTVAEQRR
jgi:DnaK suppressor protein